MKPILPLTSREQEIFDLMIVQGLTQKETAYQLGVKQSTVVYHLHGLQLKYRQTSTSAFRRAYDVESTARRCAEITQQHGIHAAQAIVNEFGL